MRMIIRQYVSSLKEENELDTLLSNTLYANKIIPQTKTTKGARQRGVDIEAIGLDNEGVKRLYIITVKQGDLDRKMWDQDQNAVRQSVDQIIETHLRLLNSKLKKLPCTIVVATNGEMKQTVDEDWKGYVEKNSKPKLEFEFWGLGTIADMVDTNIIADTMLSKDQLTLLRKTLALVEDNEYDLTHYYQLINNLYNPERKLNQKNLIKTLRLSLLLQNVLYKWCEDIGNIKNAYVASERLLLVVSNYIIEQDLGRKKFIWNEYFNLFISRLEIGWQYAKKIRPQLEIPYRLGHYSNAIPYEYPIICLEQLGILAEIGLEHLYFFKILENNNDLKEANIFRIQFINESITLLIKNNPGSYFPQFDDHIIDISLVLQFYYETMSFDTGHWYLELITNRIIQSYKYLNKFFPLFRTDFDELNRVWGKSKEPKSKSSHLILILAEWNLIFGNLFGYQLLSKCCSEKGIYKDINLQMWMPDSDTENSYYSSYGMSQSGTTVTSYLIPEKHVELVDRIFDETEKFNPYDSFEKYTKFWFLPNLASRHYRKIQFPILWRKYFVKKVSA